MAKDNDLDDYLVQCVIINTHSPTFILIEHYKDWWPIKRSIGPYDSLLQELLQMFLHYVCFHQRLSIPRMLGNRYSDNSWISCSTSLLDGRPLSSWKTTLYTWITCSSYCFCFSSWPSKDASISIFPSFCWFPLKNINTNFLFYTYQPSSMVCTYKLEFQFALWALRTICFSIIC